MKSKTLLKAFIISAFALISLMQNINIVEAETPAPDTNQMEMLSIDINLNSPDAANQIKTAILDELKIIDLNNIYIDDSKITLDTTIDTSKVNSKIVKATIDIKSKLSDPSTLTKQIITQVVLVNVVDVVAPEISLLSDSLVIAKNQEFNPWDLIEYAYDDSHVYPTVSVLSNNVDTSTTGNYEIIYSAVDESHNRTTITVPVIVSNVSYNIDMSSAVYSGDDILYMLDLINAQRAANGLAPYELGDENAQAAAGLRATEASANVSHTRPDGSHYKTAFDQFGVSYSRSPLEILTYSGNTVEAKINWWMNSSGHRAILLNPNYTHIALGYYGKMWCGIAY